MAKTKVTALTLLAAPIGTDILLVIDDPGGSPISKKATIASVLALADVVDGYHAREILDLALVFEGNVVTHEGSIVYV